MKTTFKTNKMKDVFVIHGSEDGVIGVASNKKAAYRIANEYLSCDGYKINESYSKMLQEFKTSYNVTLTRNGDWVTCRLSQELLHSK